MMSSLDEAIATIEAGKARTGRTCAGCTECCKLIAVTELDKPAGQCCRHADPGRGCAIYPERPNSCRGFACLWLISPELGAHWSPQLAHIVVQALRVDGEAIVQFVVDPAVPDAWRAPLYAADIAAVARHGQGAGDYITAVILGGKVIWSSASAPGVT
jgi:hypothetical protein